MRIVDIRETTVSLAAAMRNADIAFDSMTASAVAVVSDRTKGGRPVVGYGFDSIGRYGHGGLMRERFIPRLLAAEPDALLDEAGLIDPVRAWAAMMANEKAGGHGDRAGAVGVLDMALWDLRARLEERPAWAAIAGRFGRTPDPRVFAYASGGHYRPGGEVSSLVEEVRGALGRGFGMYKIKVAGAPENEDRRRVEAVLGALGDGERLAVDASGAFAPEAARRFFAWADALREAGQGLAWVEEPAPPLDYAGHAALAADFETPIATGENLFSLDETRNLLRHGGLRADRDAIQLDIGLSYGLPEYARIVELLEAEGWSPRRLFPHAGHLLALHACAAFGLGGWETTLSGDVVIGGVPEGCAVDGGYLAAPETPGFGFDAMPRMAAVLRI